MYKNCKMVKVHIYSPDIPESSADFTQVTPWYRNSNFFTVSSSWEECSAINAVETIHAISIYRSTRYPLLLGVQTQCRIKSCPRILYMSSMSGIEHQTSRSQIQHHTTEPQWIRWVRSQSDLLYQISSILPTVWYHNRLNQNMLYKFYNCSNLMVLTENVKAHTSTLKFLLLKYG
jgi:hypothetical protein